MPEHPLRRLLSRIVWASDDPSNYRLVYIHRGAENDQVTIDAAMIDKVDKGSFRLKDGETAIPFHRILTLTNLKNGESLWQKRSKH